MCVFVCVCVCVCVWGGAHYAWGSVPRLTLWIPWTFFKMSVKFFKFCKSWLYTVFLETNQNIYYNLHELLLSNIISVYLWLKSQFFSDVILFFFLIKCNYNKKNTNVKKAGHTSEFLFWHLLMNLKNK